MRGVRIRWRGLARVAAAAVVVLVALNVLPTLLRAPEPPPLGADVGLPRAEPTKPARKPAKPEILPDKPASVARIGSQTKRPRRRRKPPPPAAKPTQEPVPEYTPPPAPEPVVEPVYEPPPAPPPTVGDGSEEFAPH
jgi:hypothetical protein